MTLHFAEQGRLPEWLCRALVRRRIGTCLKALKVNDAQRYDEITQELLRHTNSGPLMSRRSAQDSWQESFPPDFHQRVLGPYMHTGAGLFESGINELERAEHAMLALIAERAHIRDGHRILDLGCGWGAFSFWAAKRFPHANVHAVADNTLQREWLRARAHELGFDNIHVDAGDIKHFAPEARQFDRIVMIDTFARLRNVREMLARCARWLDDYGRLLIHTPAHRHLACRLQEKTDQLRPAITIFEGEFMPGANLPAFFQSDLQLREHWWLTGQHHQKTANAWLRRLEAARDQLTAMLRDTSGDEMRAKQQLHQWRSHLMEISEFFGYGHGQEWGTAQYLFEPHRNF